MIKKCSIKTKIFKFSFKQNMTRRIPLIRFKYGNRAIINQELGLSTTTTANVVNTTSSSSTTVSSSNNINVAAAAAAVLASSAALVGSWNKIPARFRPRPLEEEEMEAIRFGGAGNDILPIGFKPALAKKGGKKENHIKKKKKIPCSEKNILLFVFFYF
jgi:hypothetical protein